MDAGEVQSALRMAILLNLHRLPQLKGKGKIVGAPARDRAVDFFAEHVAAHVLQSNVVMLKGPPSAAHSTGGGSKAGEGEYSDHRSIAEIDRGMGAEDV